MMDKALEDHLGPSGEELLKKPHLDLHLVVKGSSVRGIIWYQQKRYQILGTEILLGDEA